jgi:hypothetical protein
MIALPPVATLPPYGILLLPGNRMKAYKIERGSMIPLVVHWLSRGSVAVVLSVALLLLVIIVAIDYTYGAVLTMAAFYLVPIALVALRFEQRAGLIASIVCGVVWLFFEQKRALGFFLWPDVWNMLMRVGIFVAFAFVLSRIKWDIMRETQLNNELQAALAEVKQLSGLLPICAWCKRIRDEQGNWEPMETYITVHSEADFTHGICPDCAQKYHHNPTSR